MSPPLRTAIVGFGRIAAGYRDDPLMARYFPHASHAQALTAHPGFDLLAAVDPAPAARAAAREIWRIPHVVADAGDLPAGLGIEVAVLTLPPAARTAALAAMPDVRALLVEKPLGPTGGHLLAACARRGIKLQVNYWRRGVAAFRALAAGGLARRIGRVQAAFATYGNGVANNGSHLVDFLRLLLGEVVAVQATGPAQSGAGLPLAGDVDVSFCLNHADGSQSCVQPLDFRAFREVGLDLWGERGRLQIVQESLVGLWHAAGANRALQGEREVASDRAEREAFMVGEALYCLYDNLVEALEHGRPLLSDADNARATEEVLRAVLASAAAGGRRIGLARSPARLDGASR